MPAHFVSVVGSQPPAEQSPLKDKPLPLATPRDHKAIVRGKGLLLVELWRASFIGAQLAGSDLKQIFGSPLPPHVHGWQFTRLYVLNL